VTVEVEELVVDGIRSRVQSSGPKGAREAVVCVHGNPGSSEDFERLLPRIGELGRVVAPDLPGYGKADRPRDFDYTVDGFARHLGKLIDQLGIERVHFVLHDFGAPFGLTWSAAHKTRVASLTLFNMGLLPGYRWHKFARIWRTPVLGELFQLTATRGAFKLLLNADNPKPFPDAFVQRMFDDADWPMKRGVLKLDRATSDVAGLSENLRRELAPLRLPALVIWGDGDKYLPVSYAQMQKDFFDADVHVLAGAGHWPMVDEPDRVEQLVLPFLAKQLARA
jgi:pimeloyl-ACP methyl ester carboxylesterase